jgi:hypothetical protein
VAIAVLPFTVSQAACGKLIAACRPGFFAALQQSLQHYQRISCPVAQRG